MLARPLQVSIRPSSLTTNSQSFHVLRLVKVEKKRATACQRSPFGCEGIIEGGRITT